MNSKRQIFNNFPSSVRGVKIGHELFPSTDYEFLGISGVLRNFKNISWYVFCIINPTQVGFFVKCANVLFSNPRQGLVKLKLD
jgi:hypothetical protein